ncbi:AbgT family transporter [Klebsiella pneumoniae]|uniref:AbgT family transporter n=1 Tax=Klebsiella pneumoniae TaxID=573 RepID=UPI001BCBCEF8|nr:AbgT family transporter [Klebsiella pneumoniae]
MSMSSIPSSSPGGKRYGWVEKIGNKVPHPFLLFIYLIAVLIAATAILSALNVGVQNPTDGSRVVVKNLLSVEGLHWFLPNVIKNFSGFAPLGAILALVLGAGFAERVGLLPALMVKMASHVSVIDNWYFMATSVIVLTLVGGLITDKLVEPRLGQWQGSRDEKLQTLTPGERFGLRIAGVATLVFVAVIALMVVPENGILRDPVQHTVMPSPFIKGIVPLIIFFFFVVSLAYGIATGKIRRQADLPQLMIEPMKEMAGFIVMVFPLAQFVAMFNWSNMGKFMAVGLTDLLESSGMNGVPAFVGLALLSAFLCMFIASGSAIWSILAPIFVPMFMLLGFHPAFAQILFRIADSSVLPLAPVSPFVPLFLGFLQRYRPDARLGTYYSLVLPYPLIFLAVWLLLLVGWYLVGLPIGPGIYPRLS